jgi:hypothetical protein
MDEPPDLHLLHHQRCSVMVSAAPFGTCHYQHHHKDILALRDAGILKLQDGTAQQDVFLA